MIIHDVAQGTKAWKSVRKGIPTASLFSNIITPKKEKSASQERYLNQLLAERILGEPLEDFQSQAMADGNRFEERAVGAYEFKNNITTYRVGFVTTDDGRAGCSPDRFITEIPKRALEAKAPSKAEIHVAYLRASTGAMKEYICQLMGQIWICEKDEVDIISYFAGMRDALFTVTRDDDFIKALTEKVGDFCNRLDDLTEDFRARGWITESSPASAQEAFDRFESAAFLNQDDIEWAMSRFTLPEQAQKASEAAL